MCVKASLYSRTCRFCSSESTLRPSAMSEPKRCSGSSVMLHLPCGQLINTPSECSAYKSIAQLMYPRTLPASSLEKRYRF